MKIHPVVRQSLLFLLILFVLNEGIKLFFYQAYANNMPIVLQDQAFHQVDRKLDFLIMGHSRGMAGVDTTGHPELFNFCTGGESNIYTYYKLKHVLEVSDVEAEVIVLPSGFGSFNMRDINHTTNSFYWDQYVDYLEVGEHKDAWWDYLGVSIKAKIFPYFQLPSRKLDKFFAGWLGDRAFRRQLHEIAEEDRVDVALASIEANHIRRSLMDSISVLYLFKTLELCQQHQQKVAFVSYPTTSYYLEAATIFTEKNHVNMEVVNPEFRTAMDTLQLLDYTTLYQDRPELFRDVNHLNKDGAKEFTPVLLQDLKTRFDL